MRKNIYNRSMKKSVLLVLMSLLIGVFIGYWIYYPMGYDAALATCRAKLESIGLSQPKTDVIRIASGKIISISGDKITLEIYPPTDLLQDSSKAVRLSRVATVNDQTIILSRSIDLSRLSNRKPGSAPVSPFVEKTITVKDLVLGTMVDITAESDMSANNEFIANKIVVNAQH